MRNSLFFLLLLSALIYSCGGTGGSAMNNGTKSESGYLYTHHIKNGGKTPVEGDEVTYNEMVYLNDSLLYSTWNLGSAKTVVLPKKESVAKPPPPNYEMLLIMSEGDSVTVTQTLDSIPNLPPQLKPTDKFHYQMALVSIRDKAAVDAEADKMKAREGEVATATSAVIDGYQNKSLKAKTLPSGLKYIIHDEGTGKQAVAGKTVSVNYSGFLLDKSNFDNSFKRGRTFDFPLGAGRVIKGWDEGIALLKEGAKATLFIPSDLGYGERGSPPNIPPNSELVFYVELVKVN